MSYYENVVIDYLRADRSLFLNTQYCLQVNDDPNPDTSGPHWYCDAVAVAFRTEQIYLCEITFAKAPTALMKRLADWNENWDGIRKALERDSKLPPNWAIRSWLFIRKDSEDHVQRSLTKLSNAAGGSLSLSLPKITFLEDVAPWKYCSWNRPHEDMLKMENAKLAPVAEMILQIGGEGGDVTLYGVRQAGGWVFSRRVVDQSLLMAGDGVVDHATDRVPTWDEALALLDRYPWHKLYPLHVHAEFRDRVFDAVLTRFEADGDTIRNRLPDWAELCGKVL